MNQFVRSLVAASALTLSMAAMSATEYNGDRIEGIPVITRLDVSDLAAGQRHNFYFKSSQNSLGQYWYVPVIVFKGQQPGKKVLLNSSIHGNELNGLQVIREISDSLDPATLKGTVISVPGANPAAMLGESRSIPVRDDNDMQTNLNRVFPGKEVGNAAERHAWLLWNNLYANNVDYVYDLHTNIKNAEFPLFVYADYSNPEIRRMADLMPADIINQDMNGAAGTLETTFVRANIPAVTLEMGEALHRNNDYIQRAVTGIRNLMVDLDMLEGRMGKTARQSKAFYGNVIYEHVAKSAGQVETEVKVGEFVKQGQRIMVQRDPFGRMVQEYRAESDGVVAALSTDPLRGHGNYLFFIMAKSDAPECAKGCWLTR